MSPACKHEDARRRTPRPTATPRGSRTTQIFEPFENQEKTP
jgi:hypothetical protein